MAYTTIDDPSAYFQTALYTGNGTSTNAITNDGNSDLKPDWLWLKSRSITSDHIIFDSTRGTNKRISANTDSAEETQAYYSSFNTDGFTIGSDNANVNQSSATYVNWQWKANGGTTTTNDASATGVGSIDSVYQANTTAGFSIVTYTGTGSIGSLAHGLGAVPHVMMVKNRSKSAGESWTVYHHKNTSAPETENLQLNTTNATSDTDAPWNDTAPTSTVFTVKNDDVTNDDGETFVGYFFREIQGYSRFGSYTGNGNADGPFVYTGFKPAWLMYRNVSRSENWIIVDNKRNTINPVSGANLQANVSDAEANETRWEEDFLSNGFKIRTNGSNNNANNGSGETIIYMAFAESPFVSSEGVPTTAR